MQNGNKLPNDLNFDLWPHEKLVQYTLISIDYTCSQNVISIP